MTWNKAQQIAAAMRQAGWQSKVVRKASGKLTVVSVRQVAR